MASRPSRSGRSITTWRSNRPGRRRAVSRTSGRLVAAIMMTPSCPSKPSISTSSEFRVCSRSSLPPPIPAPRCLPTASISSMKTKQGAFFRPCSNISRTLAAPTPTNISTKSEPLILKKGTSASPATALASKVFPVPGGPTMSTPLGIFPPILRKRLGSFRKSTISATSSFASSQPATSPKTILSLSRVRSLALLLPKFRAPLPAWRSWRTKRKYNRPIIKRNGKRLKSKSVQMVLEGSSLSFPARAVRSSL